MPIIYLTPNEEKTLRLLMDDLSSYAIIRQCEIPSIGLSLFKHEIRRKTGIRDTKNTKEIRQYFAAYDASMAAQPISVEQVRTLRLFLGGDTFEAISYQMGVPPEGAEELIYSACRAAGIFTRDDQARKTQVRLFLAIFHPSREGEQTPDQMTVLRLTADGLSPLEICDRMQRPLPYVRFILKTGCLLLGLTARGRDVQRNLIRAYFTRKDAENPPVTMDDPAF
jgi:DNA-binding CsgD family transcriptional regulator